MKNGKTRTAISTGSNSFYHSNEDHPLFINEVGSREWSPKTWDARLPNLYFAGDYCINQIDIATVEAGVVSGLQAAQELARNERLNAKIELILPDVYPESAMALWKIALAPYAAAAKCWSDAQVIADRLADGAGLRGAVGLPGGAASMLAEDCNKGVGSDDRISGKRCCAFQPEETLRWPAALEARIWLSDFERFERTEKRSRRGAASSVVPLRHGVYVTRMETFIQTWKHWKWQTMAVRRSSAARGRRTQ